MGLDNGIMAKGINPKDMPNFVYTNPIEFDKFSEICYWRKCWGLRGEINHLLHMTKDDYEMRVDREDIPAIQRVIMRYLNPSYWEENADSIWTFEEIMDKLIHQYMNLAWLYSYMEDHPNIEVKWYDSY